MGRLGQKNFSQNVYTNRKRLLLFGMTRERTSKAITSQEHFFFLIFVTTRKPKPILCRRSTKHITFCTSLCRRCEHIKLSAWKHIPKRWCIVLRFQYNIFGLYLFVCVHVCVCFGLVYFIILFRRSFDF